jgi:hypothetical protein
MRRYGMVRTLGLLLACLHGAACDDEPTPPYQPPGPGGPSPVTGVTAMGPVIGAPGLDAGQARPDASSAVLDGAAPALDASVPGVDAALAIDAQSTPAEAGRAEGGVVGTDGAVATDGASPAADGAAVGSAAMPGTVPIPAPVADDCITNVNAGDHEFICKGAEGVEFHVMVDERCTKFACGLIFDVHGAAMTGQDMRDNGRLHQLAASKGYLTVHPTATSGAWNFPTDGPILKDFMTRMIKAFHVDTKRVHMTGFSMGAGMTFWFLCNHTAAMASTAPVTGQSASQVTVVGTGAACIESINENWRPRVPILFMSGIEDGALTIEAARQRTMGIVTRLGLTGGQQVGGDDSFTRKRWTGAEGMVFDFLEHEYTNFLLQGHCIPSDAGGLFGCDSGGSTLKWGPVVLQWFIDHPKP